jgi:PAP2 superfamily
MPNEPQQFAVLRDVTIISALLAVACYRLYPVAPPRFVLAGSPEPVQDWTYGGTSVDPHVMQILGFNPYAAFPSVHVLWALIPAWCLATGSRSRWVWLSALCFPLLIVLTVICTGNHYVLDCVGSVVILAGSCALVRGLHHVRQRLLRNRWRVRHEPPAAVSLCLACAGILVTVGINGGIRVLIAVEILLLVAFASGRSPYLWARRRVVRRGAPAGDTLRLCRRAALRRRRHRCGPAGGPLRLVVDPGVCAPVAARLYLRSGPACDHETGVTCRPVWARNATTVCPPQATGDRRQAIGDRRQLCWVQRCRPDLIGRMAQPASSYGGQPAANSLVLPTVACRLSPVTWPAGWR